MTPASSLPNPPPAHYQVINESIKRSLSPNAGTPFENLLLVSESSPDNVMLTVAASRKENSFATITYREMVHRIYALNEIHGEALRSGGLEVHYENRSALMTEMKTVVGYLDAPGLDYVQNFLFFNRLGWIPLMLSPANSVSAIANLLQHLKIDKLIIGSSFTKRVPELIEQMPNLSIIVLKSVKDEFPETSFDLSSVKVEPRGDDSLKVVREQVCLIIHSSGSTNMPKPICLSNRYCFCAAADYSSDPTTAWLYDPKRPFLSLVPTFHVFGFVTQVCLPLHGAQGVLMPSMFPATSEDILWMIEEQHPSTVALVPHMLSQLVKHTNFQSKDRGEKIWETIKSVDLFIYGGASLPQKVGDAYVKHKVRIHSYWGASEIGRGMRGAYRGVGIECSPWEMSLEEGLPCHFEEVPGEAEDLKQLVVHKESPLMGTWVANRPDGSWASGDLFRQVEPNIFIYEGRIDDQLVHITGEKTNALAIEKILVDNPLIAKACVVGSKRPCCAALVQLHSSPEVKQMSDADIMDSIIEAVNQANAAQPSHSRIPKGMIYVLNDSEELPSTPKGNPIRSKVHAEFKTVIDDLYRNLLGETPTSTSNKVIKMEASQSEGSHQWTASEIEKAIMEALCKELEMEVDDFEKNGGELKRSSVFSLGLTSTQAAALCKRYQVIFNEEIPPELLYEHSSITDLTAFFVKLLAVGSRSSKEKRIPYTEVRSIVKKALEEREIFIENELQSFFELGLNSVTAAAVKNTLESKLNINLPVDFIFENSTLKSLSDALNIEVNGSDSNEFDSRTDPYHINATDAISKKYIDLIKELSSFRPPSATKVDDSPPEKHRILITGASGSLGNFAVRSLLHNDKVERIYCLLRGENATGRMLSEWQRRKLDRTELQKAIEQGRVVCLSYDMSHPTLGQDATDFENLQQTVTCVIHNSWKMDFNQKVEDFESDCIRSVYNLIKFCTRPGYQRKRFVFISSISSSANVPGSTIEPKVYDSATAAVPMGYGQSKWVSEKLCEAAAQHLGLAAEIARVGQVSGDTMNGVWNTKELYSLLIVAGASLHALPSRFMEGNVLPVDCAGNAVGEIALKTSDWGSHCGVYHLSNPSLQKWPEMVQVFKDAGLDCEIVPNEDWWRLFQADQDNQAHLLDSFLSSLIMKGKSDTPTPSLSMKETAEALESIRNAPPVTVELAKRYLSYWRSIDFLKDNKH